MSAAALQLPWENDTTIRWFNVHDFAQRWRRTPRHVRRWCVDGTLVRWGYRVYRDPQERWWIGERVLGHSGHVATM